MSGSNETPRIAGIATRVPPYPLPQQDVVAIAAETFGAKFPDFERLRPVFENTGINMRYSVRPFEWFRQEQNWAGRTQAYLDGATQLFEDVARDAIECAGLAPCEIDAVVTVSSTGIATPSLEARAHSALGLRHDVRRVPVFGLGCAGGISGLSIAARLAKADPGARVLVVAIEICTLAFRADELSKSNIVATALFGDGAAAAVLVCDDEDGIRVTSSGEHLWPDTLDIMGWAVDPIGFSAIFATSIPDLVTHKMRPAVEGFLARQNEALDNLDAYVFHPGGTKVVQALETAFDLEVGALDVERAILRDFGNMSAPTALFVLQEKLVDLRGKRALLSALGPGFTGSFVRLDG